MAAEIRGARWLLISLALQNLGRRKARSLLLITSVAIGSAVVFTGATLMQSIDRSMSVGFTRMGADMMVVPEGALTWEIDEFLDRPLVLAEIELPAEDTEVVVPGWLEPELLREVTGEVEYSNSNIAAS